MKTKKIISLGCAALLALTAVTTIFAKDGDVRSDWPQFRGPAQSAGVTDAKTPTSPEETVEKWAVRLGSGWGATPGTPIIVGEYLYDFGNGKLNRISTKDGELVKAVDCPGKKGFFSYITYGDGKIFVPCTLDGNVVVIAYDEQTMEQVWVTEQMGSKEDQLQPLSSIVYHDGYIYMGASNGQADKGVFACFTTEDENPAEADEIKQAAWTYAPSEGARGYYWANGVVVGDAFVFGGENGQIVLHSLTEDTVYDTVQIGGAIRSTLHYDSTSNRIFATTKDGSIHSVKLNANHTFDQNSLLSRQIGNDITSSPVAYNGRVYVGGGGISSNAGFTVLNAETLEIIYQINELQSQSSPILTTAYATEENNWQVYLFMVKYNGFENGDYSDYAKDSSCVYVIQDSQGQTQGDYKVLAVPSQRNYCTQSVAVGSDGSMYYYNDTGYLFGFGHKDAQSGVYTALDVINAINRLPAAEKITSLNRYQVARVRQRYAGLSQEEQSKVTNLNVLEEAEKRVAEPALIEKLVADLAALDIERLTLEDFDQVNQLQASYLALSEAGKRQVSNYAVLQQAIAKLGELQIAQTVSGLQGQIDALKPVDALILDDKQAVELLYRSYMEQSDAVKRQIDGQKLLDAKQYLEDLQAEIDAINDGIWAIDPRQLSLKDKAAVEELIARYQALKAEDQSYVEYADELMEFQKQLQAMEQEQNKDKTPASSSSSQSSKPNSDSHPLIHTGDNLTIVWVAVGVLVVAAVVIAVLLIKKKHQD